MRRLAISILVCILVVNQAFSQYTEIGATLGSANYIGDISSRLETNQWDLGLGLLVRHNFSPRFSIRGQFLRATISGSDVDPNKVGRDNERNLSFKTHIYELSCVGELNVLKYNPRDGKISAPYLFAGVAGYYYNPQARYKGQFVDLRPLGTEGQLLPGGSGKYSAFGFSIPFGTGVRFSIGERINLGMEIGMRYTFTDYLDDVSGKYPDLVKLKATNETAASLSYRRQELYNVSLDNPIGRQRGDNYANDLYFYAGFSLTYNLCGGYGLEFDKKYNVFKKNKSVSNPTSTQQKGSAPQGSMGYSIDENSMQSSILPVSSGSHMEITEEAESTTGKVPNSIKPVEVKYPGSTMKLNNKKARNTGY